MKKVAGIILGAMFSVTCLAQSGVGAGNEQNFRFGLKAMPSVNWYKPDNTKKYENGGAVMKFNWGLTLDFKLSNSAWLSSGLEVSYDGGNINFKDTVGYLLSNSEFQSIPADASGMVGKDVVQLKERRYNTTYVTLPLNIKMKTKEIGMLNYYGMFGLNLGVKVKTKVTDTGYLNGSSSLTDNEGLDNSKDMGFFRAGINIGGGAEWNLSGTTSLVFGLQYNLGFTNVVKGNSDYVFNAGSTNTLKAIEQKFASHFIGLSVGVLF